MMESKMKICHSVNKYYQRHYGKLYEWSGKSMHLSEWEKELGIPRQILSNRISSGWSVDRAFTTPMRPDHRAKIKYHGRTLCYADIARITGVSRDRVAYRIKHGYSVEEAFADVDYRREQGKVTNLFNNGKKDCPYPDCDSCPYEDCIN